MKVELHNYERSTHDLGYLWRSTAAAGTIIPFITEVGLPGDTFDIDLDGMVMTKPTVGPLFGNFKFETHVFLTPLRLYNGLLHNNALDVGLKMNQVLLPRIYMSATYKKPVFGTDLELDNSQINPSSIFKYLGISGVARSQDGETKQVNRFFNAVPWMIYADVYKNYYANKQEGVGAYIHTGIEALVQTLTSVKVVNGGVSQNVPQLPAAAVPQKLTRSSAVTLNITAGTAEPKINQVILITNQGNIAFGDMFETIATEGNPTTSLKGTGIKQNTSNLIINNWRYLDGTDVVARPPEVVTFPLKNIDDVRKEMLATEEGVAYEIASSGAANYKGKLAPFGPTLDQANGQWYKMQSQEGLLLKTYLSDKFNNWMRTEWIDGAGGVNDLSAVSVVNGKLSMDALNLAQKVYRMLNRVAISGGSYDDWMDAIYVHDRYKQAYTPMYMGGMSKNIHFQEVISNSESTDQPLGTLGGRGVMDRDGKGGRIHIKVDEPSYITGYMSITPRLDYSQGNKWDVNLKTMDDLHKPGLDQIGYQDLVTDQMAWWDTYVDQFAVAGYKSAGKQPAWMNYMTNVNQVRGNFAMRDNEMFMTLNRRYQPEYTSAQGFIRIKDLTTYIDPAKYNYIFAETSRDAQNFWVQIKVGMEVRRKMSAKQIPNL